MEGGDLARLWKGGKKGCLSPLMQAKAWGLSEAGVRQVDIAAKLEKIGGGHPTQSAVCKLLERIADDPEWFPGKRPDASYGPAPVLRGAKRKQVAASAMLLKRRGVEPNVRERRLPVPGGGCESADRQGSRQARCVQSAQRRLPR